MLGNPYKLLSPLYRGGLRTQKPQGRLVLDPDGPLPIATAALAMNEGHGKWIFDASGNNNHFELVTYYESYDIGWIPGRNGTVFDVRTASNSSPSISAICGARAYIPSFDANESTRSFSLSFDYEIKDSPTTNAIFAWNSAEGHDNSPWILMRANSSALYIWVSGSYKFNVASTLTKDVPVTIGLKYDHVAGGFSLYLNGEYHSFAAAVNTGGTPGSVVQIGYGYNGGEIARFDNFFLAKDQAWSDETFRQLHRDPWSAFKPAIAWMPVAPAAAGGGFSDANLFSAATTVAAYESSAVVNSEVAAAGAGVAAYESSAVVNSEVAAAGLVATAYESSVISASNLAASGVSSLSTGAAAVRGAAAAATASSTFSGATVTISSSSLAATGVSDFTGYPNVVATAAVASSGVASTLIEMAAVFSSSCSVQGGAQLSCAGSSVRDGIFGAAASAVVSIAAAATRATAMAASAQAASALFAAAVQLAVINSVGAASISFNSSDTGYFDVTLSSSASGQVGFTAQFVAGTDLLASGAAASTVEAAAVTQVDCASVGASTMAAAGATVIGADCAGAGAAALSVEAAAVIEASAVGQGAATVDLAAGRVAAGGLAAVGAGTLTSFSGVVLSAEFTSIATAVVTYFTQDQVTSPYMQYIVEPRDATVHVSAYSLTVVVPSINMV